MKVNNRNLIIALTVYKIKYQYNVINASLEFM